MNKEPIISIITPYYNAQEYIEDTAKSVINQTFPYFEWIIVDDGSSEEGKEKLKQIEKMDKRIKVFSNRIIIEQKRTKKNRPQMSRGQKRTVPKCPK